VQALKKWKHYLLRAQIKTFADNVALKLWRISQNMSPRHVRWQAYISMFDIGIFRIPEVANTSFDALSSLECRIAVSDSWEIKHRKNTAFSAQFCHGRLWDHDHIMRLHSSTVSNRDTKHSGGLNSST